jgi:hypothetical protein
MLALALRAGTRGETQRTSTRRTARETRGRAKQRSTRSANPLCAGGMAVRRGRFGSSRPSRPAEICNSRSSSSYPAKPASWLAWEEVEVHGTHRDRDR